MRWTTMFSSTSLKEKVRIRFNAAFEYVKSLLFYQELINLMAGLKISGLANAN